MGAEYELKFRGNPQILTDFPGSWETITMQTTYYDTPSGSLSAKRYMLRRRLENGVSVCTLKTPGKGNLRGEWEVNAPSIADAIQKLCKLDCPEDLADLCAEGLIPICGAAFTRRIQLLQAPDMQAELAFDEGILFGRDKELPLREIELELKAGSREALDLFAKDFAEKHGLIPEEKSKFARALALNQED